MNVQEQHVMQIPAIIAVNDKNMFAFRYLSDKLLMEADGKAIWIKDKLSFEGVDMKPNVWYHISPSIKEYLNSYLKY